jgi:CubicO group peptidase (beta-lactamase class C family)
VAQLVAAGKVRLDDAIGGHVDGLKPQTAAVTVRQLLTHTSGLGNFFTPENLPAIEKARTVADLMPLVAADEPAFPPGSRVQYSNTGFLLLGRLVERVSGERYGQYLAGHVFAPAHMTASGLDPGPSNVQAVGMTARMGALRPAPEAALHGNPAGGSYSSAADLQKFFAALLGGQLKITEQRLGFAAGAFEGHRWFGHNGGAPGANVETAAFPDDGVVVVVLSNRDPPTATALFREVRAALFAPSAGPCVTR